MTLHGSTSQNGTAAVVDGSKLLVTPLRTSAVPPPLCAVVLEASAPILCIGHRQGTPSEVCPALSSFCCRHTDAAACDATAHNSGAPWLNAHYDGSPYPKVLGSDTDGDCVLGMHHSLPVFNADVSARLGFMLAVPLF